MDKKRGKRIFEMREIKFRAYCKETKKMVDDIPLMNNTTKFNKFRNTAYVSVPNSAWNLELMQFTGLLDKNSKKIYEGDIVRCVPFEAYIKDVHMYGIRKVVFDNVDACFYYDENISMSWGGIETYEVIGNIYENEELLK